MCPATSLLPCNQIKLLRLWLVGPERNGWTQVNQKNWGKQPSRGALSWRGDVNLCHDCWGEKRHRLQHLELYTAGMTYCSTVSPVICSNNLWGYQMFEVVKSTQRRGKEIFFAGERKQHIKVSPNYSGVYNVTRLTRHHKNLLPVAFSENGAGDFDDSDMH